MKKLFFISLALGLGIGAASATTTFAFNEFGGGISSSLSNAAGASNVNGLFYGVIIDKDGGGFATTTYDPVVPVLGQTFSLTSGGLSTDAVIVFAANLTGDQTFEGAFTDAGGGPSQQWGGVSGVSVSYTNGIAAGQTFQLIWFDPSLGTAGVLSSNQFVIPTDAGATLDVDDVFLGADPIRAATGITFQVVPEPTTAILGAIGALGLLRRRR